ncbi:hypothetical protein LCGC14_3014210 [marine sediment metagenome]|uniref:Uncharacterized protein n=1 Tax=marine sediment metagenome TaxID=412755 RepID=A0A0F8ZND3_9ZZZZ
MNRKQREQQRGQQKQEREGPRIRPSIEAGVVMLVIVMAVMLLVLTTLVWQTNNKLQVARQELQTLNAQVEVKLKQTQDALTDIGIFRRDLWDKVDEALEEIP